MWLSQDALVSGASSRSSHPQDTPRFQSHISTSWRIMQSYLWFLVLFCVSYISRHGSPNPGNESVTRRKDVSPHWMRTRWAGANARRPTTRIACGIVDPCLSSEEREYESMDAHARVASCEMDFGSLPTDVLRLILPIQGKAACIAAQVCSSWRSHIKSQLLGYDIGGQSLPNWCRRWQVADLSEANFAFGTLCRIQPQLLQQADVYNSSGQVLGNRDLSFQDVINHVQLGQAIEPTVFQFFTSQSLAGDSICWNNVALMEHSFGDDLDRMESWWMLVEGRLNTKEHGLSILQTLRFGSTWQHLYNHASRLSPEVFLHASFSRRATRPRHFLRPFSGLLSLFVSQWAVQRCDRWSHGGPTILLSSTAVASVNCPQDSRFRYQFAARV